MIDTNNKKSRNFSIYFLKEGQSRKIALVRDHKLKKLKKNSDVLNLLSKCSFLFDGQYSQFSMVERILKR